MYYIGSNPPNERPKVTVVDKQKHILGEVITVGLKPHAHTNLAILPNGNRDGQFVCYNAPESVNVS
jgi:hypothetical protein